MRMRISRFETFSLMMIRFSKDFITMNRMMRRSMKDRGEQLTALTVDKEYRQIDILAIYK